MRRFHLSMRRAIAGLLLFGLAFSFGIGGKALVRAEEDVPGYAPGVVLVGLKEGAGIDDVLKDAGIDSADVSRLHNIKPAVTRFKKDYRLERDAEGWYWFMGKQYHAVEEIPDEALFKEAYKKMPPAEKALYRSYKVKLPKDMSVEEAVSLFQHNPGVEYAEPNYILKMY
ncbi:MAG: hypothetical protein HQ558_02580 [Candidatus Omnitrophica bacterium]|nr:hypothetical protein [Candidatus Omnitrophota bacterium]